jgi:hypothetical protein
MKAPTIQQFRKSFGSWADGLPGKWKGDAYCYHPHGVIARPMIYTDHHNVSGACDAHVMTDPEAKFKRRAEGREASIGNDSASPNPTPETGQLVMIYRNGEWVGQDGPWRARMRSDMARVLRDVRRIERQKRVDHEAARMSADAASKAAFDRASKAFA